MKAKTKKTAAKKVVGVEAKVGRHWWKWLCEFCYRQSNHNHLPNGWDLVWQSAVCPSCQAKVKRDGGYNIVRCGAYANGKPDPRA